MESHKHILVTGGAGYVGSALVPKLLDSGYSVTVLDLYLYGEHVFGEYKNNPNLKEVRGDLRHPASHSLHFLLQLKKQVILQQPV